MLTLSFNCCVVVKDMSPNFSKSQLFDGKCYLFPKAVMFKIRGWDELRE